MITASELRQKYLQFFASKGHKIINTASLIPENDPTVLFTTAGMHPLVPYLLGQKHPSGKRLTDVQVCIRTGDIDEVGDNTHLTFFEMLGNWSLGDYFKKEAIEWSFEFLTSEDWLNIPKEKLAVTVFKGEKNIPEDDEAAKMWHKLGISKDRIQYLGREDNWWGPAGLTGPCGPDTEMFYWTGTEKPPKKYEPTDKRWVEIWNDVFMQYNKTADGNYEPLAQTNVDTGMGLERTLMVLNGKSTVYDTDLFSPILRKIEELSGKKYGSDEETTKAMRVIADHVRAATFILADRNGVTPSNVEQGYILRRLIRRAVRFGRNLGIDGLFTFDVAEVVITIMKEAYPNLLEKKEFIHTELSREEEKFGKTIDHGLNLFTKLTARLKAEGEIMIPAVEMFHLYDTYGFPPEMTKELALEAGFKVDEKGFETEFKHHQEKSRLGSQIKFAGGLADHSVESTRLHTATHLLHKALRDILGTHVEQRGSNITPERLRFDFSHPDKMTKEQIQAAEDLVNKQISRDLPVHFEEMSFEEAQNSGAIGLFEHKYGDKVKVYIVGDFSKEVCGGPHVEHTALVGKFKIVKEEAVSAGIRRIKAIVE